MADDVGGPAGLAYDEALLWRYRGVEGEAAAETLRLYTYRAHCGLVGRYQDLERELDVDHCRSAGIDVARRPTGGGAIIMGPGQLGVAIAGRAPTDEAPRATLARYARLVIAGLEALGVPARFRAKNDLEVGGRKIAGLGLYRDEAGALLFHASVLVSLDTGLMLRVLRIPGAKYSDKAVARVEERITTVAHEAGCADSAASVRESFAAGMAEAAGVDLEPCDLTSDERERMGVLLAERYDCEAWTRGRSIRGDAVGRSVLKTPGGLLRVHVAVHGGVIKSAMISGDFNVMPAGINEFEARLRWCRAEEERVLDVARAALSGVSGGDDLGVAAETIGAAVWRAAANALRRQQPAAPAYRAGSCYFPEPAASR